MNETMAKKNTLSSKSLIGSMVKNPDDENLGAIEELLVDPETGYITEVIFSANSFLGLGKRISVPWDMFKVDSEAKTFVLNIEKDFLARIPPYRGS